jgi:hypothetical protein
MQRRAVRMLVPLFAAALIGAGLVDLATPALAASATFTSAQVGTTGTTASFSESGPWTMAWSYSSCSGGTEGVFGVEINNSSEDFGPDELGVGRSGTEYYYDSGTFSLAVFSECDWSITVSSGTPAPAVAPVTYSSSQFGATGSTPEFAVRGPWTLAWSYNCANLGSDGIFGVEVTGSPSDLGPNEFGMSGSGTDSFTDSGTFSLAVLSECDWSVTVNGAAPLPAATGYTLVGTDGGVFAFGSAAFEGSLPGLGVSVSNIAGIVPSSDDRGYFLVGSDGGVFSFGDTNFEGSLPGLGVSVGNIVGIVPSSDDRGYFLVGSDGGVFAFGDTGFEGSLPGIGVRVNDVVSIASTPDNQGYWVLGADGSVYAFGDAPSDGSVSFPAARLVSIVATSDGGGYWVTDANGDVYPFGDATNLGSTAGQGIGDIVSLVPTSDSAGYWLIGANGGVYPFGDAGSFGSLPALGVVPTRPIVGAVPSA